jgi:hypothetical protein
MRHPHRHDIRGLGVYIRAINRRTYGTPEQAAKKAADHGVRRVHILGVWQDYKYKHSTEVNTVHNEGRVAPYAEAFAAKGIHVRLWGYPAPGMEGRYVGTLRAHTDTCRDVIAGWLHDPELPFRERPWSGKNSSWWNQQRRQAILNRLADLGHTNMASAAQGLMNAIMDAMDEYLDIGVTSYGIIPRDFPAEVFITYGWQSDQVYNQTLATIVRSLNQWRSHIADLENQPLIPAVQGYGEHDREKLRPWLDGLLSVYPSMPGMDVWSWPQIDSNEWDVFQRFSDKRGW